MLVNELDGILDRHDVPRLDRVPIIDHRCQGRGLAGSRGPHHEDQPSLAHRNVLDDRRKAQVIDGHNLHLDEAKDDPDIASLAEQIDAEPSQLWVVESQIHFHLLFELCPLPFPHESLGHSLELLIREGRLREGLRDPMDAVGWGAVHRQVEIGCLPFHHHLQKTPNIHRYPPRKNTGRRLGRAAGRHPEEIRGHTS